jgi:hypothetical protein
MAPGIPAYLSGCIDTREVIVDLIRKYNPADAKFKSFRTEIRALWHLRMSLEESYMLVKDRAGMNSCLNGKGTASPMSAFRKYLPA